MDKNKLFLPIAIVLGCLILSGSLYAIQIKKQDSIERQQQIELDAKAKVEQAKIEAAQTKTETIQAKPASVNTGLKIEVCKTEAKSYADGLAKAGYLKAFEEANARGDYETAKYYLQFSYGPDHPADYDSNYNSKYISCLN